MGLMEMFGRNDNDAPVLNYQVFSDPGGREENQDCCGAETDENSDRHCFVLCDGLGGHRGGQTASRLAVDFVLAGFPSVYEDNALEGLGNLFRAANAAILREAGVDASKAGMGTTCVILLVFDGVAWFGHIGDSRLYIIRGGEIVHRSRDHSVVQLLVDMGEIQPEEAAHHPDRNRLLKTLGVEEEIKPEIRAEGFPLERDDVLVLCSDGYWEYIGDGELVRTLTLEKAGATFDERAERNFSNVRQRALNADEACDNMTAQFIKVQ